MQPGDIIKTERQICNNLINFRRIPAGELLISSESIPYHHRRNGDTGQWEISMALAVYLVEQEQGVLIPTKLDEPEEKPAPKRTTRRRTTKKE